VTRYRRVLHLEKSIPAGEGRFSVRLVPQHKACRREQGVALFTRKIFCILSYLSKKYQVVIKVELKMSVLVLACSVIAMSACAICPCFPCGLSQETEADHFFRRNLGDILFNIADQMK